MTLKRNDNEKIDFNETKMKERLDSEENSII